MPTNYRAVGLESLQVGECRVDFTMPTTLATISHIVPDTAKLVFSTPDSTQFTTEDSDDVDVEISGAASKGVEFATFDMGNDAFILAFGGAASGATIWKAPTDSIVSIERALVVITKPINGYQLKFEIPHVSLRAGGELKFSKTDVGSIAFEGTILKAGTNPSIKRTIMAES